MSNTTECKGIAYAGGIIQQVIGGRKVDMIVDLDELTMANQIPMLLNHENEPSSKIGEADCKVEDGRLLFTGKIFTSEEDIIEAGKSSKWQVSIGASVQSLRKLADDEQATINGRQVTGPLFVAKAFLREISVVAVGADHETEMTIAASSPILDIHAAIEGTIMTEEKINLDEVKANAAKEALEAERKRIADINAICGADCTDISAKAIAEGWDTEKTAHECLKHIRAARPNTPNVIVKNDNQMTAKALENGLALRYGMEAKGSEQDIEFGYKCASMSLKDICREAIRLSGGSASMGFGDAEIKAALGTDILPGILGGVANRALLKAYNAYSPVAFEIATVGSLSDFKEAERYRLTDVGALAEVPNTGELAEGNLSEHKATNKLATYGKSMTVTRQAIINDDLGAFLSVPRALGNRAARLIDQLLFARLTGNNVQADGKTLFHANHKNLVSTGGALGLETLKNAISMLIKQTDADNQPIGAQPKALIVSPENAFIAEELVNGVALTATGQTDKVMPAYNALSRLGIKVIATPYLTGNDWYLVGDPNTVDTFEIGFLNGKQTPTIETGEPDFNTLGLSFRCYFDLGVRELDYRGIVKSIAG